MIGISLEDGAASTRKNHDTGSEYGETIRQRDY
jgi:hypothetical protein